ncbi:hypothetical protein GCM10007906_26090 [Vibrio hyugaensis]|uniref:Uncharacterized protein n=1 Tax=Vibrio hyugaensis TaxID=1534743 RepID=A0ABQ5Y6F9_9VIBR|nr:hypothetical protein GCM10007906_26090 [Vibrio hyugaensis]
MDSRDGHAGDLYSFMGMQLSAAAARPRKYDNLNPELTTGIIYAHGFENEGNEKNVLKNSRNTVFLNFIDFSLVSKKIWSRYSDT